MNRLQHTALAPLKRLSLLTAFWAFNLSLFFSFPLSWADAVFRDNDYNEVYLPKKPLIFFNQPGTLLNQVPFHKPKIRVKSKYQGLEKAKVLEFEFPEMPEAPYMNDTPMNLYILDKDGQLIAFSGLSSSLRKAKISISGNINYVKIYFECSAHGLWTEDLQI